VRRFQAASTRLPKVEEKRDGMTVLTAQQGLREGYIYRFKIL
jgi:hypothetical protein